VIRSYVDYYHADRTHLGLDKDAPKERPIEPQEIGRSLHFRGFAGFIIDIRANFRELPRANTD
jgi:hypothetical protein